MAAAFSKDCPSPMGAALPQWLTDVVWEPSPRLHAGRALGRTHSVVPLSCSRLFWCPAEAGSQGQPLPTWLCLFPYSVCSLSFRFSLGCIPQSLRQNPCLRHLTLDVHCRHNFICSLGGEGTESRWGVLEYLGWNQWSEDVPITTTVLLVISLIVTVIL